MLNTNEVKGHISDTIECTSGQGTVTAIKSGTAANSARYRRRLGQRLRSEKQLGSGWRVGLGFRF